MSDLHGDGTSDARTSSGRASDTADAILRDMPQSIVTKLLALMYADSQSPVSHEWHAWLTRRSDYLGIVTAETEDV